MKIVEFKDRKAKFKQWLKQIEKTNFDDQEVISAVFIWEIPPTKEGFQATHCRYNCDLDQLKWFYRELGEYIKEKEFDKYLTEHIGDYIEYI